MPTVIFQSLQYDVYADIFMANEYLQAAFGSSLWFTQTADVKAQALVSATRTLDRQCWLGDPAGLSGQVLQWPRINTGIEGVDPTVVPIGIIDGSIELANLIVNGSIVQSTTTPNAQGIQIIKAGSVAITYFRPGQESFFMQNSRFPVPVQELVGKYMCASQLAVVGQAFGTSVAADPKTQSVTKDPFGYNEGI